MASARVGCEEDWASPPIAAGCDILQRGSLRHAPFMRQVTEGCLIHGPKSPREFKGRLKSEELRWVRAADLCRWAVSSGVPWAMYDHALGDAQPPLLPDVRALLKIPGG